MAKYVSRTVTEQKYGVKYFDAETSTIKDKDVILIKKPRTKVGLEKALELAVGGKVVAQSMVDEYDKRYGIKEEKFMELAKELPLLPKKDEEA